MPSSTPFRLLIPAGIVREMYAQAQAELPNECCGLLAGNLASGGVERRYPLKNVVASPIKYKNDSDDLFAAFRDMRLTGVEHLAIYHSHPTSAAFPSKTDREENYYGLDVIHLIISLKGDVPTMRGWRLTAETATEADWQELSPT